MKKTILVVLNEMPCSQLAVEFLSQVPLRFSEVHITLMHVLRKPDGSEEMMGKSYMLAQQKKIEMTMDSSRRQLIEVGYSPENIHLHLVSDPYPTVADGIIAEVEKGDYDMVVIGRKKMSKSEEFVMGDASIKVIRALDRATVVVVKC